MCTMSDSDYYAQSRDEMLAFIPRTAERLLDIGCSEGRFGEAVKRIMPGCETWGVEPVKAAAARAERRLDKVVNRPLEELDELPRDYFDVISMNDVLEHIAWPENALAVVRQLLKPQGHLILSLPNVSYYVNIRDVVLKNEWDYCDFGILDRTHLRFFTQTSAVKVLEQNGFTVERAVGINRPKLRLHYRLLFAVAPMNIRRMQFPQFAIVARRAPAAG